MHTNIYMTLYIILLFFILAPGQFLTLPSVDSPKMNIIIVHAIAFAVVWHFTNKMVESSPIQLKL
jgi:hypothetical protein